jgi:hypothetical protein
MTDIEINIDGIDESIKMIKSIYPKLKRSVEQGTKESLTEMSNISNILLAGKTKGTSEPRGRSISDSWSKPILSYHGNTIMGSLNNYSPHWRAVEFGTGDKADGQDTEFMTTMNMIYPIGSNPMHFKYMGRWISALEVHGQEPKAFVRGTIPFARQLIKQYMKIQIDTNLRGI